MSKVLALLGAESTANVQCWITDNAGYTSESILSFEQIEKLHAHEIVCVVPASRLTWHVVQAPTKILKSGREKLLLALHTMVESEVLDSAENLHFSVEPSPKSDSSFVVAGCDKKWLESWVRAFEVRNLRITRIAPEVTPEMALTHAVCTHTEGTSWYSFVDGQTLVTLPLSSDVGNLSNTQKALSRSLTFLEASDVFSSQNVELIDLTQHAQAVLSSNWNLCQGAFALNRLERLKRQFKVNVQKILNDQGWASARYACLAICAVVVIGLNASTTLSKITLAQKKEAVSSIVSETFPSIRLVVDPLLQMQRAVTDLRHSSGLLSEQDMMPLMAAAGHALQQTSQRPTKVDYTANSLVLSGIDTSLVAQLNKLLEGSGYKADAVQGKADSIRFSFSN